MKASASRGFTVVELVITITILVILTTIIVTRLVFTQVGGDDQERKTDMETIATGLELYYQNGSPDGTVPKGYYPGRAQLDAAAPTFNNFLDGVPAASFISPNRAPSGGPSATDFNHYNVTGTNPDGSYTEAQARSLIQWVPYLYQPLSRNNLNCYNYTDCVKFNLYYINYRDDTVVKIMSKNQ